MKGDLTFDPEAGLVYGRWLSSSVDLETALEMLQGFVLWERDGWTGNSYWFAGAPVPDWLLSHVQPLQSCAQNDRIWGAIDALREGAGSLPRVQFGRVVRDENNPLGYLTVTYDDDGSEVGLGAPPNHVSFLEMLTGATDWRQGVCDGKSCFVLVDGAGAAVGLVTACADDRRNRLAIRTLNARAGQ